MLLPQFVSSKTIKERQSDVEIGGISELNGSAQIVRNEPLNAKLNFSIQSNDEAVTANGRMSITFLDDSKVSLTEHSQLTIDEYIYDPNPSKSKMALTFGLGTARFITDSLKQSLSENIFSKLSLIFSYFSLKRFKAKLDPRKYNGAIFLGLNGPVVKSHGGTDAIGFYYSIDLCYKIIKGDLMNQIKNNLSHLDGEQ